MAEDFPHNLRLLCSYRPSITQVAADLGIHRSQLNRYLAGGALPRPPIMRRIADHFGLELHELMMPHHAFADIVDLRGIASESTMRSIRSHLDRVLRYTEPRIRMLEGTFFEYYHSMSTPGKILRSLIGFRMTGQVMTYRRLERLGAPTGPCARVERYAGAAVMTGYRVFMHDYETGTGVELTQTILCPDYSHRWNSLHGLKLGISSNRGHLPCAARVVIERTPAGSTVTQNLRACGFFEPGSADLPRHVIEAIHNGPPDGHVFEANLR